MDGLVSSALLVPSLTLWLWQAHPLGLTHVAFFLAQTER